MNIIIRQLKQTAIDVSNLFDVFSLNF